MRDLHRVVGRKQKVASIEDALAIVRRRWPTATKDGAMATWSFMVGEKMVAEAWMSRRGEYWWLRTSDHDIRNTVTFDADPHGPACDPSEGEAG